MSGHYTPNKWVLIRVTHADMVIVKVFGMWSGGYLDSDSWRLSSGVTVATESDGQWHIENESGSIYTVNPLAYDMTGYGSAVFTGLQEKVRAIGSDIEIIPENEIRHVLFGEVN